MLNCRCNVSRGLYKCSREATTLYEDARRKVGRFIGAEGRGRIIFTQNATSGINLVARGIPWQSGDRVVTTYLEHHSNYLPWLRVAKRRNLEFVVVKPTPQGIFNLEDFEVAITDNTKLVAITMVSNVLGVRVPVDEIIDIAHKRGALVLLDGAQAVCHIPVDVSALNCDFLAGSGHKMLGPPGIGWVYIREELFDSLEPLFLGGGVIKDVRWDSFELSDTTERFEAGTPNIVGAIGFGAAVDYLTLVGVDEVESIERRLVVRMVEGLRSINGVKIYGSFDEGMHTGIVSFNITGIPPHQVALLCEKMGSIAVRAGHHCCMPLMKYILEEPDGTVRASVCLYNTEDDVDVLVDVVRRIAEFGEW